MKRKQLTRYLERSGCLWVREGARHSVYYHPATHRTSTVPRHKEIDDFLAAKICKDLGIKPPKE